MIWDYPPPDRDYPNWREMNNEQRKESWVKYRTFKELDEATLNFPQVFDATADPDGENYNFWYNEIIKTIRWEAGLS